MSFMKKFMWVYIFLNIYVYTDVFVREKVYYKKYVADDIFSTKLILGYLRIFNEVYWE